MVIQLVLVNNFTILSKNHSIIVKIDLHIVQRKLNKSQLNKRLEKRI